MNIKMIAIAGVFYIGFLVTILTVVKPDFRVGIHELKTAEFLIPQTMREVTK